MAITPRSLFNIVLKIFGLFFLREIINEIPTTVTVFIRYFTVSDYGPSIAVLLVSLLILAFYTVLALQLLFRTNPIINALKLDKGFSEDEFSFEKQQGDKISLTTTEILMISLIVLGGYILVDEIPSLCKQVYLFIDERKSFYRAPAPSSANILTSIARILLALLIIGERKRIISIIESRKKEEANDNN